NRLDRRRRRHRAGAHVETRAVARTLDLEAVHLAAGQVAAIMGARVLDGIKLSVDVVHGDRGIVVPDHLEFAGQQLAVRAHVDPVAHAIAFVLRSFSSHSNLRSSRRGMPNRGLPYGNAQYSPVRRKPRRSYHAISSSRTSITVMRMRGHCQSSRTMRSLSASTSLPMPLPCKAGRTANMPK